MSDRVCSVDRFAKTIEEMVGDVPEAIDRKMPGIVSASAKLGREKTQAGASAKFDGTGRYAAGWANKRKQIAPHVWVGTVYNKDVPGLPHLLEKGHAKVGGGRVAGREHIATAADAAFDDFERRVRKAVNSL